jgi:hypothetical protein
MAAPIFRLHAVLMLSAFACVPSMALASEPTQLQLDEIECSQVAIKSSGYDPAHPPVAPVAQAAPATGSGARVRGAAAGAAVGAIGGNDVGNAAAKGAVAGAVVRRNRNRAAAASQNQANANAQQAGAQAYASAKHACMVGKGYK